MPVSNEDIDARLKQIADRLEDHGEKLCKLQENSDVFHKREKEGQKTNAEQIIEALKVVQAIALIGTILKRVSALVILVAATWAALKGVLPK